ncbi:uncharacterized protein ACIQIH_000354 [Cyanocitta cristata]
MGQNTPVLGGRGRRGGGGRRRRLRDGAGRGLSRHERVAPRALRALRPRTTTSSSSSTTCSPAPPTSRRPRNIPASHPLLVRHAEHGGLGLGTGPGGTRLAQGLGRSQRTLRQLTPTPATHHPRALPRGHGSPTPPLILQRLLGPSAAADILQLSSSLPLQSRGRARLLVGNEDVHIIAPLGRRAAGRLLPRAGQRRQPGRDPVQHPHGPDPLDRGVQGPGRREHARLRVRGQGAHPGDPKPPNFPP